MNARVVPLQAVPVIGCWLLLLLSGCATPLLYKPAFDLEPILALRLPTHIDTLKALPRDETVVEDGINRNTGGRQPDDIKELLYFTKMDTSYRFVVFFSEHGAMRYYDTRKRFVSKYVPAYRETSTNGRSACVYYTEQPRADPEGGSVPMGYYVSKASFRLRNVFIHVSTRENDRRSDKLKVAICDLAGMLRTALNDGNAVDGSNP